VKKGDTARLCNRKALVHVQPGSTRAAHASQCPHMSPSQSESVTGSAWAVHRGVHNSSNASEAASELPGHLVRMPSVSPSSWPSLGEVSAAQSSSNTSVGSHVCAAGRTTARDVVLGRIAAATDNQSGSTNPPVLPFSSKGHHPADERPASSEQALERLPANSTPTGIADERTEPAEWRHVASDSAAIADEPDACEDACNEGCSSSDAVIDPSMWGRPSLPIACKREHDSAPPSSRHPCRPALCGLADVSSTGDVFSPGDGCLVGWTSAFSAPSPTTGDSGSNSHDLLHSPSSTLLAAKSPAGEGVPALPIYADSDVSVDGSAPSYSSLQAIVSSALNGAGNPLSQRSSTSSQSESPQYALRPAMLSGDANTFDSAFSHARPGAPHASPADVYSSYESRGAPLSSAPPSSDEDLLRVISAQLRSAHVTQQQQQQQQQQQRAYPGERVYTSLPVPAVHTAPPTPTASTAQKMTPNEALIRKVVMLQHICVQAQNNPTQGGMHSSMAHQQLSPAINELPARDLLLLRQLLLQQVSQPQSVQPPDIGVSHPPQFISQSQQRSSRASMHSRSLPRPPPLPRGLAPQAAGVDVPYGSFQQMRRPALFQPSTPMYASAAMPARTSDTMFSDHRLSALHSGSSYPARQAGFAANYSQSLGMAKPSYSASALQPCNSPFYNRSINSGHDSGPAARPAMMRYGSELGTHPVVMDREAAHTSVSVETTGMGLSHVGASGLSGRDHEFSTPQGASQFGYQCMPQY
jgi:hypothetical protein